MTVNQVEEFQATVRAV